MPTKVQLAQTNIFFAGVSYLGVQIYQQHSHRHFRSIPDATAMFQCSHFAFLPSTAFLCLLSSKPNLTRSGLELAPADLTDFDILSTALPQLAEAAKSFRKRTSRNGATQRDEEGDF
ncbi:uncharacterized protein BJ212DRAFT_1417953 [Suillus subaureus]|uniref:Uncharacterized protein n=1 Tax=Suillus subaureus TaxID=48587 RepID=A0A9P7DGJ6_9AGAM|nr:uncharacterized protein BJ212DRAFT_1417953 [Suillus subaureus]KAG1791966.1 hypothetical protein BJ212DRAFT_1417953 [Suillus subaureus]